MCDAAGVPIARHFTELIVWQLGDALRVEILKITRQGPLSADLKFRSQLEDAIDSVCRNIAEGFGCGDREFARFLVIARRSLNEVQDGFLSALHKGYATPEQLIPARRLLRRLLPAIGSLIRTLDRGRQNRPTK